MSETQVLDFSSMETPTLESTAEETTTQQTAEETTAQETTQQTEETQQTTETQRTEEQKAAAGGGKVEMKAIRDAVKAFETANPELGKHLKSLLDNEGRIRAYQETYPDVDTARSVKAAIEAVGGLEGVAKLSELQDFVDDVNAKWDAGDPAALETIFEDGGAGAVKLLPHYMNRVEKANPEVFGESIRPHLVRSLQASNFEGVLAALAKTTADKPEAKEIVDSVIAWYSDQKRLSEKSNLDALKPERDKLNEERSTIAQEKNKIFEQQVNSEVIPHINRTFGQQMRSYLEHDTRPDAAKQDISRAWLTELGKALEKDQKQIETMMKSKSRNKDAIANYARTRISAVAEAVTKKIVEKYKLAPGKPGTKTTTQQNNEQQTVSTTAIKVNQKPSDDVIDWDKDPDRMLFITGKAYLKGNGRLVKWR